MKETKRKSIAWQYFTDLGNFQARCTFCLKIISFKGGSPYNLLRHTKSQHSDVKYAVTEVEEVPFCVSEMEGVCDTFVATPLEQDPLQTASNTIQTSALNPTIGYSVSDIVPTVRQTLIEGRVSDSNSHKTSIAWKYFMDLGDLRAQCNTCLKIMSYKGGGPFNLIRHTKVKHPEVLSQMNEKQHTIIRAMEETDGPSFSTSHRNAVAKHKRTRKVLLSELMFAPNRRKSVSWQHFTDLGSLRGKCNMCGKVISYKGGGPYNLLRHTRSQHPEVFENTEDTAMEAEDMESPTSKSTCSPVTENNNTSIIQSKHHQRFKMNKRKFNNRIMTSLPSPFKSEKLNQPLMEMIAKDHLPLRFVESAYLKKVFQLLNPSYQIPTKEVVENHLLSLYYNSVKEDVQKGLSQAKYISLSIDGWTSSPNENYKSVTAHFIDEQTQLKSFLLACFTYMDQYTAEELCNKLKTVCENWKILDKVVAVTADDSSNVKDVIALTDWRLVPCFAHTLDLIVQTSMQEISRTRCKVASIIDLFGENAYASERLTAMQKTLGEQEIAVKRGVTTGWISTYAMFQSILTNKRSLMCTIAIEYPELDNLNDEDCEILMPTCELLSNFKDLTEVISAEKHLYVSEINLLVNALQQKCREFLKNASIPQSVSNMTEIILNHLQERLNLEDNYIYAESLVLDPRFKKYGFLNKQSLDRACSNLKCLAGEILIEPQHNVVVDSNEVTPIKSNIWDSFDLQINEIIKNSNPVAEGVLEMEKYLEESLLPRKMEPLSWWHARRLVYPRLYELVRRRFCVLASSLPPEHLFTKDGQDKTCRRNALSGDKVAQLLFLSANM